MYFPESVLHSLLLLLEASLHLHVVFVKLVLSQDIAPDTLVERIDFDLLELASLVLALDHFETFLKLQLQESMLIGCRGANTGAAL